MLFDDDIRLITSCSEIPDNVNDLHVGDGDSGAEVKYIDHCPIAVFLKEKISKSRNLVVSPQHPPQAPPGSPHSQITHTVGAKSDLC